MSGKSIEQLTEEISKKLEDLAEGIGNSADKGAKDMSKADDNENDSLVLGELKGSFFSDTF